MRIFIAIALILALLVTVFAVQNNQPITISFLFWSIEGSLALVLMITLVLGIVVGVLLMTPGSVRTRLQISGLKRQVRTMEEDQTEEQPSDLPASVAQSIEAEAEELTVGSAGESASITSGENLDS